jgi:hypothetical protein
MQQRRAFFRRHILEPFRVRSIDVQRLAACLRVRTHDRMQGFQDLGFGFVLVFHTGQFFHLFSASTAVELGRIVMRLEPVEQFLHAVGQGFVR